MFAANNCIPFKRITIRQNDPPWMLNLLKSLIRKQTRQPTKANRSKYDSDWANYRSLRNKCVNAISKAISEYQLQLSSDINNCNNPRKWWKVIGKLLTLSHNHDVTPLIVNGPIYEKDKDTFSYFNEFLCKQTEID